MARLFSTQIEPPCAHLFHYVTIADFGPYKPDFLLIEKSSNPRFDITVDTKAPPASFFSAAQRDAKGPLIDHHPQFDLFHQSR